MLCQSAVLIIVVHSSVFSCKNPEPSLANFSRRSSWELSLLSSKITPRARDAGWGCAFRPSQRIILSCPLMGYCLCPWEEADGWIRCHHNCWLHSASAVIHDSTMHGGGLCYHTCTNSKCPHHLAGTRREHGVVLVSTCPLSPTKSCNYRWQKWSPHAKPDLWGGLGDAVFGSPASGHNETLLGLH